MSDKETRTLDQNRTTESIKIKGPNIKNHRTEKIENKMKNIWLPGFGLPYRLADKGLFINYTKQFWQFSEVMLLCPKYYALMQRQGQPLPFNGFK